MIYVDVMRDCIPNKNWRWGQSCHLFCGPDDDLNELHRFASRIGLRRSWFQIKRDSMPHYDLNTARRAAAVAAGAVEADRDFTVTTIRAWRAKTK